MSMGRHGSVAPQQARKYKDIKPLSRDEDNTEFRGWDRKVSQKDGVVFDGESTGDMAASN